MKITDLLKKESIDLNVKASSKKEVSQVSQVNRTCETWTKWL